MMKRLTNLLIFTITLSFLASCVAEKKGKSPSCGFGEEFNKVSQKCINVRRAPTSTLETIELYEDSPSKTFTLKYTDANNDQAIDCQVFDTVSEIEIASPIMPSVKSEALTLLNHANSCATSINNISFPAQSAAAIAQFTNVLASYNVLLTTEDTTNVSTALTIFSNEVRTLSNMCEALAGQPIVQYYGSIANNFNNDLFQKKSWIDKRCFCAAGVCTSEITPLENKNGDFGITYNITEGVDGTSVNKEVLVSVIPVNDLPYAVDFHFEGFERTDVNTSFVTFTIPFARDVESDMSFNLTYEIVSMPINGSISGCAISSTVTSNTDRNCYYLPFSDDDGLATPLANKKASFTTIGTDGVSPTDGIIFEALVGGSAGELVSFEFLEHPLKGSGENVIVKTNGRLISIYIEDKVTTIGAIIDAVNADMASSSIVFASPQVPANKYVSLHEISAAPVFLTASAAPFDTFSYRVRDEFGASLGIAYASVDIKNLDDRPVAVSPLTGTTLSFTEDTATTVTLITADVENNASTSCSVTRTDSSFVTLSNDLIETVPCDCSGGGALECSVTLKPKPNFNGMAYFKWTVTDTATPAQTTVVQNVAVNVAPVNDAPHGRLLLSTFNESATATPVPNSVAFTFSQSSGVDIESDLLSFKYKNDGAIGLGVLSGCLSGDDIILGATCYFTPGDGNLNGVSTTFPTGSSTDGAGSIVITSKTTGEESNDIVVNIIDSANANGYIEFVEVVNSNTINVYVDQGTSTLANVKTAIEANIISNEMVSVSVPTSATISTNHSITLSGAEVGAHKFNYTVTDSNGASVDSTYHINIIETDDNPILCPYSTFPTVTECGLDGCVDSQSPIARGVTPTSADIYFYDTNSAVCYKSAANGGSFDWNIVTDFSNVIQEQIVHQNGSFKVSNLRVDEGGGDSSENVNTIRITDIVVNDGGVGLIPKKAQNIKIYYAGAEVALSQTTVGVSALTSANIDGAGTSDASDFEVEIIPANSKVGSATVVVTFQEFVNGVGAGAGTIDMVIPVTVTNISIQHKGWQQVIASGPKVDTFGAVKDQDYVCNYSESECSNSACTGTTADLTNAVVTKANVIYLDTTTNKCYYSKSAGSGILNWQQFDSYCGITPQANETSCSTASCLSTSDASGLLADNLNSLHTKAIVDPDGVRVATTCYRSYGTRNAGEWEEYRGFGSVLLKWNPMAIIGTGSIMGFNVYRRLSHEDFDYTDPINRSLVSSFSNSYLDDSTNSKVGPIPNTVYFYEVVPLVQESGNSTQFQVRTTKTTDKTVLRILVPGENKSLVPRDIVNVTMCNKMNDSLSTGQISYFDSSMGTYTCAYEGIGDNVNSKYDIGSDLIVDRFEAGCSYTKSPDPLYSCQNDNGEVANDGSCIGTVDPTVDPVNNPVYVTTGNSQIYYNRTTGTCYKLTAGTKTWTEVDSLADFTNLVDKHSYSQLPPIVNISQVKANSFCQATSSDPILGVCPADETGAGDPVAVAVNSQSGRVFFDTVSKMCFIHNGATWVNYRNGLDYKLPTRKEQVAYSEWDYSLLSTSTVNNREQGLSLNSNSKCNSTYASGLDSFYTDSVSPIFSSIFTLPGTLSSNIRSVMTGSEKTNLCESKYGLQDTIGNVSEWSSDRMYCSGFSCTGSISSNPQTSTCDTSGNGIRNELCAGGSNPTIYADRGSVYEDGSGNFYINVDNLNTWKRYAGALTQTTTCDTDGDLANDDACAGTLVHTGDPTGFFLGDVNAVFDETNSGNMYINLAGDRNWTLYTPGLTQSSSCDTDLDTLFGQACASPSSPDGLLLGGFGEMYTDTDSGDKFINFDGNTEWYAIGDSQTSNCNTEIDAPNNALDDACSDIIDPEGQVEGSKYSVFTNTASGDVFIKTTTGTGNTGWTPYMASLPTNSNCDTDYDTVADNSCSGVVSFPGDPNGVIMGNPNNIYTDTTTGDLYINHGSGSNSSWRPYDPALTATSNCDLYEDGLADDICTTPIGLTGYMSADQGAVYEETPGSDIFVNTDGKKTWALYSSSSTALNNDNDFVPFATNSSQKFTNFGFNGESGPCVDVNSDGVCDAYLTSWILDQKSNGANRFSIPLAMPMTNTFVANNPGNDINAFIEQIGISSGITSTLLQDDEVIINQGDNSTTGGNTSGIAGIISGGSYKNEQGSGTHFLELVPKDNPGVPGKRDDIGFRCVAPVYPTYYVE